VTLHQNAKTCPASRRLMCRRVEEEGWSVRAAAEAAGVSEPRARAWLRRWRGGDRELADRRSGPAGRHPRRTDPQREAVIAELRGEVRMSAVAIADALGMPERTVRGVIARLGLSKLPPLVEPEPANRYERPMPGELVHVDVKKLGRIGRPGHRVNGDRRTRSRGIGWEFVHVCVDDCTRLAYVEVLADERKETVTAFLQRAVAWFAERGVMIQRLMTDNGSGYRSALHRRACEALGIRHLFTRPYRPRTNGKAERFIRTLLAGWAYQRPYATSAERRAALAPS
jgi:transposase InsO family protein